MAEEEDEILTAPVQVGIKSTPVKTRITKNSLAFNLTKENYERCVEYVKKNDMPTITGLAAYLGTTRSRLDTHRKNNEQFAALIEVMKEKFTVHVSEGALTGRYNSSFAKYLLSARLGLIEKTEQQVLVGEMPKLIVKGFGDDA